MRVIVTIAGKGQRFQSAGYSTPKPLVPIFNKPALHYLVSSFSPKWKLIFVLGEHFKDSELPKIIQQLAPDAKVLYTPYSERGPVDTVLTAMPSLDPLDSVAVSYCDYAMVWDPVAFEKEMQSANCDMSIISYRGFHPTYLGPNSYAHLQVDEKSKEVLKIQEKKLFGTNIEQEWTSAGFYFFKTAGLLKRGLELQLQKGLKYGNEYYTSLAIQALIDENQSKSKWKILNYEISHFMQMGTPFDIEEIKKWYERIYVMNLDRQSFSEVERRQYDYWTATFQKIC